MFIAFIRTHISRGLSVISHSIISRKNLYCCYLSCACIGKLNLIWMGAVLRTLSLIPIGEYFLRVLCPQSLLGHTFSENYVLVSCGGICSQ